jgi:hypothetical protein
MPTEPIASEGLRNLAGRVAGAREHRARRAAELRIEQREEYAASPPSALFDDVVAALILGVSTALLSQWRADDRGPPYVRVGRAIKYRRSDLDHYVDTQRHVPQR